MKRESLRASLEWAAALLYLGPLILPLWPRPRGGAMGGFEGLLWAFTWFPLGTIYAGSVLLIAVSVLVGWGGHLYTAKGFAWTGFVAGTLSGAIILKILLEERVPRGMVACMASWFLSSLLIVALQHRRAIPGGGNSRFSSS